MGERRLHGKRIVVTRAAGQAAELTRLLEAQGAEVLHAPAIQFTDPEDFAPLDAAIARLPEFDWLVLTSQNAVRFFVKRCQTLGADLVQMGAKGMRTAAVGSATADAMRELGLRVDVVAGRYHGQGLAEDLGPRVAGKQVLLPRSDRAASDLPEALRRAGAAATDVVAYRTVSVNATDSSVFDRITTEEVDVITFASPSAFRSLAETLGIEQLRRIARRVALAAIGPITADAVRAAGLPVEIEAAESTAAGLVAAIAGYYRRASASRGASD